MRVSDVNALKRLSSHRAATTTPAVPPPTTMKSKVVLANVAGFTSTADAMLTQRSENTPSNIAECIRGAACWISKRQLWSSFCRRTSRYSHDTVVMHLRSIDKIKDETRMKSAADTVMRQNSEKDLLITHLEFVPENGDAQICRLYRLCVVPGCHGSD